MLKLSRHLLLRNFNQSANSLRTTYAITKYNFLPEENIIHITWNDERNSKYAVPWLRDNAPHKCTIQLDTDSVGRKLLMQHFDPKVQPLSIELNDDGLEITWPKMGPYEQFKAFYEADWLRKRDLTRIEKRDHRRDFLTGYVHRLLWNRSLIQKILYTGDYNKLLTDDYELYEFLRRFLSTGLAVIHNVPKDINALEKFFGHFGYMYCDTPFGASYEVKNKLDASNLKDSNRTLGLHLDLPYNSNPPDIQALHIIKQSAVGGESIFADGFHVARQILEDHPDVYDLLTKSVLEFIDDIMIDGNEYIYTARRPVIARDERHAVKRIYFDNQNRSWHLLLPVEKHQAYYEALKMFNDYVYNKDNAFTIKFNEDEIVLFTNSRVLHGRIGFEIGEKNTQLETENERHLKVCYGSFDQFRSRMRVLQKKLNPDRAQVTM